MGKFERSREFDANSLGTAAVKHTVGDTDLPINVKAVVFDADGTISYKNTSGGSEITGFPVSRNAPLWFIPARITAMTGPTNCFLVS